MAFVAHHSVPVVPAAPSVAEPLLPVVRGDHEVPLADGSVARYADLDIAASAPSLVAVKDAVDELLPWYASVHRGAGFTSTVCTELLEAARGAVGAFLGAGEGDQVVWTRSTTDSLNLLSHALPQGTQVLTFDLEHHANLLPWRRHQCRHLPTPFGPPEALVDVLVAALATLDPNRPSLVALTGASNVTGEVLPLRPLIAAAKAAGAWVVVDAAQLAPHRGFDLRGSGADWVAVSGHKLYAPFGAGALVGRADVLDAAPPYLQGGGAVRSVDTSSATWTTGPARHEAGTPNVVGAVALGVACRTVADRGFDEVASHDAALAAFARRGLSAIPGVSLVDLWPNIAVDRVGIVTFTIAGLDAGRAAAALSAEHGVGVRDGSFCAHPLVRRLLGSEAVANGGALRASIGVGSTLPDVARLVEAVAALAAHGPRAEYVQRAGRWVLADDRRPRPQLLALLGGATAAPLASCGR